MSWAHGLILVLFAATALPYLFCMIADRFGADDEWDEVAERKRRTERRAKKLSGEFQ